MRASGMFDVRQDEVGKSDLAVLSMQVAQKVIEADDDTDEEDFGSDRTTVADDVPSSSTSETESRRLSNASMLSAYLAECGSPDKSEHANNCSNKIHGGQLKGRSANAKLQAPPGLEYLQTGSQQPLARSSTRTDLSVRPHIAPLAEPLEWTLGREKQWSNTDCLGNCQGPHRMTGFPTESDIWNENRMRVMRRLPFVLHEMKRVAKFSPPALNDSMLGIMAQGWRTQTGQHHGTALHLAASFGKDGVMPLLVTLGADPRATDDKGRTALDFATEKQQWGSIWMLQKIQACQCLEDVVALADFDGGSAAMIKQGLPLLERLQVAREVIRLFLVICELSKFLNIDSRLSRSVRCLITLGADHVDCSTGYTSLHVAAQLGRDDLIPLLMSLGADPEVADSMGRTAIDIALGSHQRKCADMLMILGAHKTCDGTAWVEAVERVRNTSSFVPPSRYAAR